MALYVYKLYGTCAITVLKKDFKIKQHAEYSIYMTRDGYKGVSLPESLIKQIDQIIKDDKYGYRSRAEFQKDAIRLKLEHIE